MAKKELDFNKLDLVKKPAIKKPESNLNAEKAVSAIHQKSPEKERLKQVSFELPFSLYVELKKAVAERDTTLKEYFRGLCERDLSEPKS